MTERGRTVEIERGISMPGYKPFVARLLQKEYIQTFCFLLKEKSQTKENTKAKIDENNSKIG